MMGLAPRRVTNVVVLMVIGVVISGCGSAQGTGGSGSDGSTVDASIPQVNTVVPDTPGEDPTWGSQDFPGLTKISPKQLSDGSLPFIPATSDALGTPVGVFESSASQMPAGWSALLIEYGKDAAYGQMRVIEYAYPPGDVEPDLATELSTGCVDCSENRLIQLEPNIDAALSAGASVTSVIWLQAGLELRVLGPSDSFSSDDAIKAATTLADDLASN